jgi:two-component system, chemotaxis family, sensor kinase CheA
MDDLIKDFLVETKEGLEILDNDLIELEKHPDDKDIIGNLFRAMHTIKGTCGFLGLSRLEHVAHAGEDVMDKVRSGEIKISQEVISIILESVDHIRELTTYLEENEIEQPDSILIAKIRAFLDVKPASSDLEQKIVPTQQAGEDEDIKVAEDSNELQAIFDSTPGLIDKENKPVQKKKGHAAEDSNELQAIFDATQCLVEMPKIQEIQNKNDAVESKLPANHDEHKKPAAAQSTIRININVLEELMQSASELVLTRNQLLQLLRTSEGSIFTAALQRLNNITTELQEGIMKTRMQPVGNAWTKLPRIVRDLSMELGKKIELKMSGEETELDRQLLEMIGDPLTHMIRNSADHGIELPAVRKALGKSEAGTVNINAYHGGGYIIIEIIDDGKGINPVVIRKKAIEKGLVTEILAKNMTNEQILQFIFAPGLSTAEKVTAVSGRGVGMDVVKNNIEKISGTVELESEVGKGSKFTIRIPLTLAIMPVLKLEVDGNKFAIPQINVREVVKTGGGSQFNIELLDNSLVLRLRGRLLPLVSLGKILGINGGLRKEAGNFVIICELGNYSFGVIVDKVLDTEEIVVKPVSPILKSITIYSGSTILGDGSVILILEPNSLAKASGELSSSSQNILDEEVQESEEFQKSSFVIFKAGDQTPKVVPLELLSRLEEIDASKIEYSHGVPVVQYRGELMRLVSVDPSYQFPKDGVQELLVVNYGKLYMGLAVEKILDIVKTPVTKPISDSGDGFLGAIVIDDKTCDIIDVSYYFKKIFADKPEEDKDHVKEHDNTAKMVLLIDDSPFFRKFIPPGLEEVGYKVTTVSSGKDAMAKLENGEKYSAIITDLTMPGMSGQEIATLCKQKSNLKHIPIIALSSDEEGQKDFESGKVHGIDAFVAKTHHVGLIKILDNLITSKERVV